MMHIVYICEDRGIPIDGHKGSSIHVRSMIKAFADSGACVTVISPRIGNKSWAEGSIVKFRKITLTPLDAKSPPDINQTAGFTCEMLDQIHLKKPINLVYERLSLWAIGGSRWTQQNRISHFVEVNAPLTEEAVQHRGLAKPNEAQKGEGEVVTCASRLFPVSPWLLRWLLSIGCEKNRISILPNGVPASWLINQDNFKKLDQKETINIGFVGSLRPWHDLQTLIGAMVRLPANRFNLTIIGDGPKRTDVNKWIAQCKVGDHVNLTGALTREEIVDAIDQMDICIAPYARSDRFYFCPIKIFEYGARHKTTITADLPELREQFPDGAMTYYKPESSDDLCKVIISLSESKDVSHKSAGLLYKFARDHCWEQNALKIINFVKTTGGN